LHRRKIRPTVTAVTTAPIAEPGNPTSWRQISGAGSSTIQGYATSMSANAGSSVKFKPPATLFQTSDSTRQANYTYGGTWLYSCAVARGQAKCWKSDQRVKVEALVSDGTGPCSSPIPSAP
jgi:hypothetical protein